MTHLENSTEPDIETVCNDEQFSFLCCETALPLSFRNSGPAGPGPSPAPSIRHSPSPLPFPPPLHVPHDPSLSFPSRSLSPAPSPCPPPSPLSRMHSPPLRSPTRGARATWGSRGATAEEPQRKSRSQAVCLEMCSTCGSRITRMQPCRRACCFRVVHAAEANCLAGTWLSCGLMAWPPHSTRLDC